MKLKSLSSKAIFVVAALLLFTSVSSLAQTQEPPKPASEVDQLNHRGHYALTNLLFYPTDNMMIGGELQWGRRENFLDGFKSDDFRIQFSFRYNFSKTFTYRATMDHVV